MNNSPYLSGDSVAELCDFIVPSPLPEQNQLRNKVIKSKKLDEIIIKYNIKNISLIFVYVNL